MHECFDVARVFDAAAANFAAAARALAGDRDPPPYDAVLCLVESRGERFLDDVRARRTGRVWRGRHGFWEVEEGCEPETLVVRRGSTRLKLIAGRQLVTRERLEVLAIGLIGELIVFINARSMRQYRVREIIEAGAEKQRPKPMLRTQAAAD